LKTCTAAMNTEKAKTGNGPRTLVVFNFPAPTGPVYVSDKPITLGGNTYRALVLAWNPIYKVVNLDPMTFDTSDWRITLANDEVTPFSNYFDTCDPLQVQVDVYHWFDGLADSDKLLIDSFFIADVPDDLSASRLTLDLVCVMEKREKQVGTPISLANWPYADPDAVGWLENIVYGGAKNVICRCVRAGGYSTLAADITAAATKVYPSIAPNEAAFPAVPFDMMIEKEQVRATASGTDGTGFYYTITRAQNGTTAAAHNKGVACYEKRSDFTFLAAGHPVKALGNVYVNGVKVLSGVTKNINASGKATLVFSSMFTVEKAAPTLNDGLTVSDNIAYTSPGSTKDVYPNGTSYTGATTNPGSAIDGSQDSQATLNNPTVGSTLTINFPSTSYGTIINQYIYITCGGQTLTLTGGWTPSSSSPSSKTTIRVSKAGGNWSDGITISSNTIYGAIYEVWKVVEYTPALTKSGSAYRGGSLTLNSAADIVVGGQVTCDIDGYQDDASGTYTGTANALIENPSDVQRHAAVTYGGFATGDIDGSFRAARTSLAGLGYKFAFALYRQASLKAWLARMAFQSRCRIFTEGVKLKLVFRSATAGASQKSITRAMMMQESLRAPKTGMDEIVNDLKAYYKMDWSKGDPSTNNCLGVCDSSATYPAGGDATSVGKYGLRMKPDWQLFEFIALDAMMTSVRDFYIGKYKDRQRMPNWTGFMDCVEVERTDILDLTHNGAVYNFNALKVEVENVKYYPGSAKSRRGHHMEITTVTTA
jgi:hypothetical protein